MNAKMPPRPAWEQVAAWPAAVVGRFGEGQAADLIARANGRILARNLTFEGGGEVDLLASIDGETTVVEVRSLRGTEEGLDPLRAFDQSKARQVRRLAGRLGVARIDLIVVVLTQDGVDLHWVPRVA